jgi:hypothetical protein
MKRRRGWVQRLIAELSVYETHWKKIYVLRLWDGGDSLLNRVAFFALSMVVVHPDSQMFGIDKVRD